MYENMLGELTFLHVTTTFCALNCTLYFIGESPLDILVHLYCFVKFRGCKSARRESRERNSRWHICGLRVERASTLRHYNGVDQTSY